MTNPEKQKNEIVTKPNNAAVLIITVLYLPAMIIKQ